MKRDKCEFTQSKDGFETTKHEIKCLSEFIDCVELKWSEWPKPWNPQEQSPWFRGLGRQDYPLIPSIFREESNGWKYKSREAVNMQAEFARRSKPFIQRTFPFNYGEYLHLMQHYGCLTRLLDWTEGSLIALYFAIRVPKEAKTPCVWMLNPSWLNHVNDVTKANKKTGEGKSLVLYSDYDAVRNYVADRIIQKHFFDEHKLAKYPVAIFPPHIDGRIVAQKSVFTLHGRKKNGFHILCKRYPKAQICQFRIAADPTTIRKMLLQLNKLGITETTIFPDLEGLAREIQAEYGIHKQA
jgi:hypothetical protein